MIWKLISTNFETMLLITIIVCVIAAITYVKLRNWCDMKHKHCCAVNLVIAIILYLISDGSDQFILYATLQVLTLQLVADFIFIPHLMGRRVDPEYTTDAISHQIWMYGIFFLYYTLLNADDKHIFYTIFS